MSKLNRFLRNVTELVAGQHGLKYQKTVIFIVIAVITSTESYYSLSFGNINKMSRRFQSRKCLFLSVWHRQRK